MSTEATGKPCTACKTRPILKRKGTRKFDICYECRVELVKEALAGRKVRRVLGNSVGLLVQYHDSGYRHGYLVSFTQHTAIIQPIGPGVQKQMRVQLGDVRPSSQQSAAYPTLDSYLASKPKVAAPPEVERVSVVPEAGTVVPKTVTPKSDSYDTAKAVALYAQGMSITDIAVACGYARGQGQNRTRKALREAGVYKDKENAA